MEQERTEQEMTSMRESGNRTVEQVIGENQYTGKQEEIKNVMDALLQAIKKKETVYVNRIEKDPMESQSSTEYSYIYIKEVDAFFAPAFTSEAEIYKEDGCITETVLWETLFRDIEKNRYFEGVIINPRGKRWIMPGKMIRELLSCV